jgi:hypothetical protein
MGTWTGPRYIPEYPGNSFNYTLWSSIATENGIKVWEPYYDSSPFRKMNVIIISLCF